MTKILNKRLILAFIAAIAALIMVAIQASPALAAGTCRSTTYQSSQGTGGKTKIWLNEEECTVATGTSDTLTVYATEANRGVAYYLVDNCGTANPVALNPTPVYAGGFYGIRSGFVYTQMTVKLGLGNHRICYSTLDGTQHTSAVIYTRTQ